MSKIYNPETGRMVLATGVAGKKLLKLEGKVQRKPVVINDVNKASKQMVF